MGEIVQDNVVRADGVITRRGHAALLAAVSFWLECDRPCGTARAGVPNVPRSNSSTQQGFRRET